MLGVVAVVVDPLVNEVAHGELADVRVDPDPAELVGAQPAHERDARVAQTHELVEERAHGTGAIVPLARDGDLVPGDAVRTVALEDRPDAPGEATPLRLDEVANALLGAPLARRGVPGRLAVAERLELGHDETALRGE